MKINRAIILCLPLLLTSCSQIFRAIDASNNTAGGQPGSLLIRLAPANYDATNGGPLDNPLLPSGREVSNAVSVQGNQDIPNDVGASDMVWQWGQFLDHDIDLSLEDEEDPFPILVPSGDPFFDPGSNGMATIGFVRSEHEFVNGTREQNNVLTSFVDGSNVYGSTQGRADALRTFYDGLLKTSAGNLLPFNEGGLSNAGGTGSELFLAGDIRANEQVGLASLHTLFVREHNYWAKRLRWIMPRGLRNDESLYQMARMIVTAELQHITYNEFLPVVIGQGTLNGYSGFNGNANPGIANEFSTAAFRFGHTMLSPQIMRLDKNLNVAPGGNLSLADAFFNTDLIVNGGIEPMLRGLVYNHAQEVDTMIVDGVRNFLFGPPGAGGFDLASLNIQRGRDHELQSYNFTRLALGLAAKDSFLEMTGGNQALADKFASVYDSVDDVDLWIGGLSEPHVQGALVGETFQHIIADQFERLRDSDAFWYENQLDYIPIALSVIENTTLSDIIRRNTSVGKELQDNAFMVQVRRDKPKAKPKKRRRGRRR